MTSNTVIQPDRHLDGEEENEYRDHWFLSIVHSVPEVLNKLHCAAGHERCYSTVTHKMLGTFIQVHNIFPKRKREALHLGILHFTAIKQYSILREVLFLRCYTSAHQSQVPRGYSPVSLLLSGIRTSPGMARELHNKQTYINRQSK